MQGLPRAVAAQVPECVDVGGIGDEESEEGGNVKSESTAGTVETPDEDQLLGEWESRTRRCSG